MFITRKNLRNMKRMTHATIAVISFLRVDDEDICSEEFEVFFTRN